MPKIAFTAKAFVRALQLYGADVFKLVPFFGKLYVDENKLCALTRDNHLDESWMKPIVEHWFDISNYHDDSFAAEWEKLVMLDKDYPDNIIVFVDSLSEYSKLNRTYASDELLTVDQLPLLLKQHNN